MSKPGHDFDAFFKSLGENQWPFPFSDQEWQQASNGIKAYLITLYLKVQQLCSAVEQLSARVEELEAKLNQRSDNSSRPPSSDSPFAKKKKKKTKRRAKKGHQGHRHVMLEPTKIEPCKPDACSCGNSEFVETDPYYTHQYIEAPEIQMEVIHFILHQGPCPCCGKVTKAKVPRGYETGYGPRLSALICEMSGTQGNSCSAVQQFCSSVLNFHISRGGIQKVIDRGSEAIKTIYEAIGDAARKAKVNYIDETSWFMNGALMWLWVMVNSQVAFFLVHANRSAEAFAALIEDWQGILVSDGYRVYQKRAIPPGREWSESFPSGKPAPCVLCPPSRYWYMLLNAISVVKSQSSAGFSKQGCNRKLGNYPVNTYEH